MSPILDAFVRSWPFDPWLYLALIGCALIYVRGWRILHARDSGAWPVARLACYLGGMAALFLALASPLEPFAPLLLQAHMVQHLLFMMVAPPLLWLGAPLFPIVRGVPRGVRTYWLVPVLRAPAARRVFSQLTHPLVALPLFIATTWLWHVPAIYERALRSPGWHAVQHLCFLGSALLFWYPVVRPYPSRPRWSLWLLFPYLILADVQNTVLSALFTFSDRLLYPYYGQIPRLGGLTALSDQSVAGVIMWVPGSVVFLVPLFAIGVRVLFGTPSRPRAPSRVLPSDKALTTVRTPLPSLSHDEHESPLFPPLSRGRSGGVNANAPARRSPPADHSPCPPSENGKKRSLPNATRLDLLRLPVLGRFLKWRHARTVLQIPPVIVAALVIFDGIAGPNVGAMNLAGVVPWIHWRGFLILGLLTVGNVFCMACPFMLPRTLARRWLPARWKWPRRLRTKWTAVALLILFFWSYEAFSLWDSPWWTAWIAVGYFLVAFAVDGLFRGASFCKYVCPIGQFNFVQSLLSPWELQAADPSVCASCRTKDCVRGNDRQPGCELGLFMPRKAGNLDCTFCLDCVHACPHDNIGILPVIPASTLESDARRSGIGRFGDRADVAALIVLLVFAAFANAAGMVAPVVEFENRFSAVAGQRSPFLATTVLAILALLVIPALAVTAAAAASRSFGRLTIGVVALATRFAFTLVPLGFAMWLAHYTFHLLTSYDAVIPVAQRFAADFGGIHAGDPVWGCSCSAPVAYWLPRFEIGALDVGWLLTLRAGYRVALGLGTRPSRALKILAPWAVLSLALFLLGVWIVLQPMQMRGTMPGMN
jgi:cytochrome c oxidase assembly factor CtaG